MAPDEAVVIDLQPAPGPRPSHGARMLQPLVGRAHGELSLGGAVELPDGPRRKRRQRCLFDRGRAGGSSVHEAPERREVGKIAQREQALQVSGHHERQRRPVLGHGVGNSAGVEALQDDDVAAGQERPD